MFFRFLKGKVSLVEKRERLFEFRGMNNVIVEKVLQHGMVTVAT